MSRSIAYSSLFLFASAVALHATTLVALWSPEQLLIAADSRSAGDLQQDQGRACKISQEGSTFFAISGLAEDSGSGFSAAHLARLAARNGGGVEATVASFLKLARGPLEKALVAVAKDSPEMYKTLAGGAPALQMIFAEPHSGAPVLAVASFNLAADGSLHEYSRVLADGSEKEGMRIVYAGQQRHIREYLKSHKDWYNGQPPEVVKNLVQLEIDGGNGLVAAPVDVLKLGQSKAEWLQKKPECAEVQP